MLADDDDDDDDDVDEFFCGMVDQRKVLSLIFSLDYCQTSSPSQILDKLRVEFEHEYNLSLGFVEESCEVVITTKPRLKSVMIRNYNQFHNILRLFDVLPNFPLIKSETKLDY